MKGIEELKHEQLMAYMDLLRFGPSPRKRSCLWSAANLNYELTSEELHRAINKQQKERSENNAG